MNQIEVLIDTYILEFGTEDEKSMHDIYKGNYLNLFSHKEDNLEDALGFGGVEIAIAAILVFVLEKVAESILEDGYKLSKELFLNYLNKGKIKSKKIDHRLTEKVIENLIEVLQKELNNSKED